MSATPGIPLETSPNSGSQSGSNSQIGEKDVSQAGAVPAGDNDAASLRSVGGRSQTVPMSLKIMSVILVSCIGFGSHWSSGVTGAMKSTLKKKLEINNAEYALLEASEDFIKTALILFTGPMTDRIGGASAMVWGNIIYSIGAILVAASTTVRSYRFMIGGIVIQAFGDVATQVAQYKVFSSWFAPSDGFASTLGFELGLGKIGSFVGQSTANVISKNMGDFSWVYWMAVVMNIFTNLMTVAFYIFTRWCHKRFSDRLNDPATGETLTESNKKLELRKVLYLPWPFWMVACFTLFQTSTASVFSANATELAEQRFQVDSIKAGYYSALSQYMGFFLVPILGIVIDKFGQRLTIMLTCGTLMFLSMSLVAWGGTITGTAASFGFYAFASSLGPTVIIDSIRTSMWYQEVFGSAYAVKIAINNSMNIIVRVITGVIQDQDDDSYRRVVIVYAILAASSMVVGLVIVIIGHFNVDLGRLQWSRTKRILNGKIINTRREEFETGNRAAFHRTFSKSALIFVILLVLGAWSGYFWGVATGNND